MHNYRPAFETRLRESKMEALICLSMNVYSIRNDLLLEPL